MQFIQNKISVGKNKSFEDICQEFIEKKNATVKTASTEEVVKVAEADEAEGSGQLEVEPLHQEGESTDQEKVTGGKCSCDGDSKEAGAAPMKASDEEGESSGQPEAEGKDEMNNDPYDDPKVKADADADVKVAEKECKCEVCECDPCTCKEADTDSEEAEGEEKEASVKEAALEDLPEAVQDKIKGKDNDDSDDSEDEGEDKEASADDTVKIAFTKIANLTAEEKTRLGKYWKNIYPDAFVDAMLADK